MTIDQTALVDLWRVSLLLGWSQSHDIIIILWTKWYSNIGRSMRTNRYFWCRAGPTQYCNKTESWRTHDCSGSINRNQVPWQSTTEVDAVNGKQTTPSTTAHRTLLFSPVLLWWDWRNTLLLPAQPATLHTACNTAHSLQHCTQPATLHREHCIQPGLQNKQYAKYIGVVLGKHRAQFTSQFLLDSAQCTL